MPKQKNSVSAAHRIKRRTFLAGVTASLVAPRTMMAIQQADGSQVSAHPDVIVIGAGAAGLAAAKTLMAKGLEVTVIEAAGRIGGRAFTDTTTFGVPYDVGAHWLHNGEHNPYKVYAEKNDIAVRKAREKYRVFADNEEVGNFEMLNFWRTWEKVEKAMTQAAEQGRDISAAQAVAHIKNEWTDTIAWAIGPWSAAKDLDDMSVLDWWDSLDGEDWYCSGGFGALVAHYGADVPVALNTAASRVNWQGDGVVVETNQGNLRGKAVIVTVSTGVLAAGDILFTPALPAEKYSAFEQISMGLYNHIVLQFRNDVFEMGPDGYLLYQIGDDGKGFGTLTNAGGHGLAYCDVGGSWAQALEAESVAGQVDYALGQLRSLLGSDIDHAFVKGDATLWGQNSWTRGSYAAAKPGAYPMRDVLRQPIGDRIFFAGEACHPDQWATVAGAHLSGEQTAKDVARLLT